MKARIFLALFLLASLAFGDDDLISIDPAAGQITLQQNGTLQTYRIKPFTDITISGLKASAAQLKPGMQVAIALADPQTAAKLTAPGKSRPD